MSSNFIEMRAALAAMKRENAKLKITIAELEEALRKARSDAQFQTATTR